MGLNAAWYTFLPDQVLKTAFLEFMQDFAARGLQAWMGVSGRSSAGHRRPPRPDRHEQCVRAGEALPVANQYVSARKPTARQLRQS